MKLKIWQIENRKVKDLIPHERNPRRITEDQFEQLKRRIQSQGFRTPPCVDEKGVLLAGHQRVQALIDLGFGDLEIPVSIPPNKLSENQKKEIIAADNLSWGTWNWDILSADYDKEELIEWGFDPNFIDFPGEFKPTDGSDSPSLSEKPQTECPNCGELFYHGDHIVKD